MDYLHDFDPELRIALEICKARLSSYPQEFRPEALQYLEDNNILNAGFEGNCLSFLLPFWLQTAFPAPPETCRRIVAGNIFGLLYFLIQDAVMDTLPGEYKGGLLPLANLLSLDFFEQYRQLLPSDSLFWSYFNQYLREWADSVIRERKGYWKPGRNRLEPPLAQMAHKAAPLKICGAALCLLNGNEAMIESLAQIIDATVITFQLLDDWSDWREDLAIGNCSFLLSQVMQLCDVKDFSALKESHVQTAVYGHDLWGQIIAIVERNQELLQSESVPQLPYLIAYHHSLGETCRKIGLRIQEQKQAMLKGGLYHFLYDNQSKT
jgi:hypothetical protein